MKETKQTGKLSTRRGLAKIITLLESSRFNDRVEAEQLIDKLLMEQHDSIKIAISGPPGVGKSSFIEAFGQNLLRDGRRIAILAIDPTSPCSGGSILGDRTRMENLSRHPDVFIRPSPSGKTLGGVARHTREVIIACENAGYDTIIIETVGVGQSEYIASSMVDVFLMLHQPNSGDDIQGIKRGILELADIIAVTKADGDLHYAAELAKNQLSFAVSMRGSLGGEVPEIILTSATTGLGIDTVKESLYCFVDREKKSGKFQKRRMEQGRMWLHEELRLQLFESLNGVPELQNELKKQEEAVLSKKTSGTTAARLLIKTIFKNKYLKSDV